ncbi:MAG TPA: GNAT family N-acetyltransferase [Gemmatimonadales bacterium]|jgi:predicted N-acetyltransferase YhbS|nr:GNAT family N-acetyltransferase [Gemmatimonadales bacterium]
MSAVNAMDVTIRTAAPADIEPCARIIHEAFTAIAEQHRFPPDFPTIDAATELATMFVNHPGIFGVVAEWEGRVVGSNFLDERDPIRGLGPITVDPQVQARGVGRRLMRAALERGRDAAGIRLLQDSFNTRSIALYASLGFDVREPILLLSGRPSGGPPRGVEVRRLAPEDVTACAALCSRTHGFERANELADALKLFAPVVALRGGRITAYASVPTFWPLNHGVAESEEDMRALLLGAAALTPEPLAFLLPTRQAGFFRWCLAQGFRVVKPMTLMTRGQYRQPEGCYFVSVLY